MGKKALRSIRIIKVIKQPLVLASLTLILGTALVYVWITTIAPELTSLPANFSYKAGVVSYDNFYDEKSGSFTGPVRSETEFSYKVAESLGSVRLIENTFDVRKPNGEKIISVTRQYGIDSHSRQHVAGYGDKNRTGYLFAPPGNENKNFTYWHVNYNVPIDMKFVSSEPLAGTATSLYEANFTADQTSSLTNLPEVGKTRGISTDVNLKLWIEPVSGYLVKYEDHATGYYYSLATKTRIHPWNRFSNTYNFNSIATQARLAEQERQKIQLVAVAAPIALAILSFIIVLALVAHKFKSLGTTKLSAASAIILAIASLLFWYVIGATIGLPNWIEPMYPGASLGIIIIALQLYTSHPKDKIWKNRFNAAVLLATAIVFCLLAVGEFLNLPILKFTLPVAGGVQEPFIRPSSALIIAIYALVMFIKRVSKLRVLEIICETLIIAVMLITLSATVVYAYYGFQNLIHLPTAIALTLIGVGVAGSEPNWIITKQTRLLGKGAWIFALVAIGLLVTTGLAWQTIRSSASQQTTIQFQSDSHTIQNAINDQFKVYINALYGGQSLFAASNEINRTEWKNYISGLKIAENYPGVQGIGYAQIVPRSQLAAHTQSVRKEGFPGYTVWPLEPTRDLYSSIVYIEPFDKGNQLTFGYDMLSEPTRREAMERARDSGEAALTGRVELVQETNNDARYGFLAYVPVFKKNMPLTTINDRRAALLGYVYSPFRMNNFMQAVIGNLANGIDVEVFDGPGPNLTDGSLMYSSSKNIDSQSNFRETHTITAAGHTWNVRLTGSSDYNNSSGQSLPNVILAGGIILSLALAAAVFSLISSRQQAIAYAERLTGDLATERDSALEVQSKDEAIFTGMAEGLIVLNRHGTIEKVNQAAVILLGYTNTNELVGKDLAATVATLDENGRPLTAAQRYITKVLSSGVALPEAKVQYQRRDGSRFWALLSLAPIRHHSRMTGAIEVFRDITAERQLDKAKDDFLSVASHQLRTPITAERWYLDILQDGSTVGKLTKRQQDVVQKIMESNIRMSELVSALLNVTRAESGRLSIKPEPTDVGKLLKSAVEELSVRFKSKNQQIVQDIRKTPIINIDPTLISQVVINLLTNANKYSPERSRVFVSLAQEGKYLTCTVRDEGFGIPAGQQNRLFTKFFRADNAIKLDIDGNGLGLYLVKTILELSGGNISYESKENTGTTFRFTLPVAGSRAHKGAVNLEKK